MERKTRQRDIILEVFESENRPFTHEEILTYAQKRLPKLGIATVYRTVKEFLEIEKIALVELPGLAKRYEIKNDKHHHHFWCRLCDKAFNFFSCPGNLNLESPEGFKTEFHEVFLKGRCENCV